MRVLFVCVIINSYIGSVITNFLINAFAPERQVLFLISMGISFHAFIQSLMNVSLVTLEKAVEFNFPALWDLDTLSSSLIATFWILNG